MLGQHPIDVMILATDLGVARDFYGDGIGLELLIQSNELERGPRGALTDCLRARALEGEVLGGQGGEQLLGIGFGSHGGRVLNVSWLVLGHG